MNDLMIGLALMLTAAGAIWYIWPNRDWPVDPVTLVPQTESRERLLQTLIQLEQDHNLGLLITTEYRIRRELLLARAAAAPDEAGQPAPPLDEIDREIEAAVAALRRSRAAAAKTNSPVVAS